MKRLREILSILKAYQGRGGGWVQIFISFGIVTANIGVFRETIEAWGYTVPQAIVIAGVAYIGGTIVIGALGYPWSQWDIGPRDYWGSSEIVECFHAMLVNVGTNLKLFVFPPIDGGVIYGVPTFENCIVLGLVVSVAILVFILIERIIHNEIVVK